LGIWRRNSLTSTIIIRTKHADSEKIKEYHRKRLEQLSQKSIGENPQLDELTEEQKQWVNRRMKDSPTSWETWDQ
jgi:hypothetical protein